MNSNKVIMVLKEVIEKKYGKIDNQLSKLIIGGLNKNDEQKYVFSISSYKEKSLEKRNVNFSIHVFIEPSWYEDYDKTDGPTLLSLIKSGLSVIQQDKEKHDNYGVSIFKSTEFTFDRKISYTVHAWPIIL